MDSSVLRTWYKLASYTLTINIFSKKPYQLFPADWYFLWKLDLDYFLSFRNFMRLLWCYPIRLEDICPRTSDHLAFAYKDIYSSSVCPLGHAARLKGNWGGQALEHQILVFANNRFIYHYFWNATHKKGFGKSQWKRWMTLIQILTHLLLLGLLIFDNNLRSIQLGHPKLYWPVKLTSMWFFSSCQVKYPLPHI